MTRKFPTNDLIREVLGKKHPIAVGWQLILETYNSGENFKNNEGENSLFIRPDTAIERDKTQISLGRVLMLGGAAFKGEKFKYWDVLPEVGDYVSFQKYQGILKTNLNSDTGKEVDTMRIQDYQIIDIDPNPSLCSTHHFIGQ